MVATDILQAQISIADGLLAYLQAAAERAPKSIKITALLFVVNTILERVIYKINKEGVENFDPEFSGPMADEFHSTSRIIHRVVALSDHTGFFNRFPSGVGLKHLQKVGKELSRLADSLREIDERWQATLADAANKTIHSAREMAQAQSPELIELFDAPCQPESPSEDALRAHLQRIVNSNKKD